MNVAEFLRDKHVEFELIPHCETFDAPRMAQALHVSGREVAKTVLLKADGGYLFVVAILPANKFVDLQRASQMLGGSKLELGTEAELAQHCPDCERGVLPPFGSQYDMKTLVDESLTEDDQIVFEGNTHEQSVRMNFADFRILEQPLVGSFAV